MCANGIFEEKRLITGRSVAIFLFLGFMVIFAVAPAAGSSQTAVEEKSLEENIHLKSSSSTVSQSIRPSKLNVTYEYRRLPDSPGDISLTATLDIPDEVNEVTLSVKHGTVQDTTGLTQTSSKEFRTVDNKASLVTHVPVNETKTDHATPIDTGKWALFDKEEPIHLEYESESTTVKCEKSYHLDGPGLILDEYVFMGKYESHQANARDQTIEIAVPTAIDTKAYTDPILKLLGDVSNNLTVGERDKHVVGLVVPQEAELDRPGWAVDDAAFMISEPSLRSMERPNDDPPSPTWIHEYVHTRQSLNLNDHTEWLTEASAEYYEKYFLLRFGLVNYDEFQHELERGDSYEDIVLGDRSTWDSPDNSAEYYKGALVVATLDRQIRANTNGEHSFEDVFQRLNTHHGTITKSDFYQVLEQVGGPSVVDTGRRFVETTKTPQTVSENVFSRTYGWEPAQLNLTKIKGQSKVHGPYNSQPLRERNAVTPNETVEFLTQISNEGGVPAPYHIFFTKPSESDENARDSTIILQSGKIPSGEKYTIQANETFPETGTYHISIESKSQNLGWWIEVVEPASRPSSIKIKGTNYRKESRGYNISISIAISATEYTRSELPVVVDGNRVQTLSVTLAPWKRTVINRTVTVPDTGQHKISIGEPPIESATIRIENSTPTKTPTDRSNKMTEATITTEATSKADTNSDVDTGENSDSTAGANMTTTVGDGFGPAPLLLGMVGASALVALRREG